MTLGMEPGGGRFPNNHKVAIRVIAGLTLIVLAPLIYWELI